MQLLCKMKFLTDEKMSLKMKKIMNREKRKLSNEFRPNFSTVDCNHCKFHEHVLGKSDLW